MSDLPYPDGEFWVFGYGSLMWDPGFPFAESVPARLYGYHRALCIRSIRYRGTERMPGLVFGLDRGGSCVGIGFRVTIENRADVLIYLEQREMPHQVYAPCIKSILLEDRRKVEALTFVVKRHHPRYVEKLTPKQIASIISSAVGKRGSNLDYVVSSVEHLESIGIRDRMLLEACKHAGRPEHAAPSLEFIGESIAEDAV